MSTGFAGIRLHVLTELYERNKCKFAQPIISVGIMHKISPLVGPLRAAPPIIGSEEERARREYTVQMSKRALIDLCQQEASKFLVQGRYDLAVPGAIQVMKESTQI